MKFPAHLVIRQIEFENRVLKLRFAVRGGGGELKLVRQEVVDGKLIAHIAVHWYSFWLVRLQTQLIKLITAPCALLGRVEVYL